MFQYDTGFEQASKQAQIVVVRCSLGSGPCMHGALWPSADGLERIYFVSLVSVASSESRHLALGLYGCCLAKVVKLLDSTLEAYQDVRSRT